MIRSKIFASLLFSLFFFSSYTQGKFYTKTGTITFFSSTAIEDIEAVNKAAVSILDTQTGDIQFAVLMKGFEFKKALMQEHFNRDYAESNQFPKSEFKGIVSNNNDINYKKHGTYPAKVKGKLTIHGQTKEIEATGSIMVAEEKISLHSSFNILLSDYNIKIQKIHRNNISGSIKITVDCSLEPL